MELNKIFPDGTKIGVTIEFVMKDGQLQKSKSYAFVGGFKLSKKQKEKQQEIVFNKKDTIKDVFTNDL